MVRSSGFGSVNYDLKPLSGSLSLWLRYSLILTLPQPTSRQLILQQARSRALSRFPTACKPTISCSISLPSRGSFHLSLTVLIHYRLSGIFSLTRWSSQIQKGLPVPLPTRDTTSIRFGTIRDFHLLWCNFPAASCPKLKRSVVPQPPII